MERNSNELCDFKRLLELCQGNSQWLKAFLESPSEFLKEHNLELAADVAYHAVRAWIFKENPDTQNSYLSACTGFIEDLHSYYRKKTSADRIKDPAFQSWYKRQFARNRVQSSVSRHMSGLFFMPVTFELSDGCSVGCSFCCLAAKRLEKVFAYTQENAVLWREVLSAVKDVIGEIADTSACYFATEPLDNPDYEKFLRIYREIMGCFPQTTTAVSQRNVKRTKAFLEELTEENLKKAAVRFSVTSLEQLEKIHREFNSRELAYVELLLNNPESICQYSKSGRSMELSENLQDKGFLEDVSCICTSGFVVNMVRRTIMLVAPHRPDELHPLGMQIYDKRTFADAQEFRDVLLQMTEKWMRSDFMDDRPLYLCRYVEISYKKPIMTIRGNHISRKFTMSEKEYECLKDILEKHQPFETASAEHDLYGYPRNQFRKKLKLLYDSGYIDDYNFNKMEG